MKIQTMFTCVLLAVAGVAHAAIDAEELATLAVKDAVAEAQASLAADRKIPADKAIAILPFSGNAAKAVTGLLKNAITAAGKTCVEGKEDPMWDAILKEIAWDERIDDVLDKATLDKFGKLKSAQYLMYGTLNRLAASERYVLAELELHVSCIATKQHVWGGSFVCRHFAPGEDPDGATKIPSQVRVAINDGLKEKIGQSLGKSARLGGVKKVVLLPIAGDFDQYGEGLVRDVLSSSSLTPVNLDVKTRAEVRFALRESPREADAIAYGVFRDLQYRLVETSASGSKTYEALAELQLWIEKGATREILWSDTVQFAKEFTEGPRGWWDMLCHYLPILREHPSAIVWIPLGILVGLIVLIKFLGAVTRVR